MPLFVKQTKAVLYVHVPKTGGSSVEQCLVANSFRTEFLDGGAKVSFNRYRVCSPQHMHAELLLALLLPQTIDYMFMTVRHPLARLVSEYRMRRRVAEEALPLDAWVESTFDHYARNPYLHDNHIRPQSAFLIPGCEVFKLEDRLGARLLSRIEDRTGLTLEHRVIGRANTDDGEAVAAAEIAKVEPRVRAFYRQDYEAFGYS
jgi:hypothetical protein